MSDVPPGVLPDLIQYDDILKARDRIKNDVLRFPLVPLNFDWELGNIEAYLWSYCGEKLEYPEKTYLSDLIYLKLENLQPTGCFKMRGATNAVSCVDQETLKHGVSTASAGNFAQGLAYCTRKMGISCDVYVPDHAPQTKVNAMDRLGANIHKLTFDEWWKILKSNNAGSFGTFVHPVADANVIAGNGTAGIEIFEDLPDVDSIVVPYGGGGLSCGIASAMRHLKPDCKVYASEVETAAPLAASLEKGEPTTCPYTATFVDGIGGKSVLEEMWPMVKNLITGSVVVTLKEIAKAIKLLAEKNHVIAEGAGASSVAAALTGRAGSGNIVCVVSGGNLDTNKLIDILNDEIPK